jgi:DNA invertase Pin-like site-specific DNA recombinase
MTSTDLLPAAVLKRKAVVYVRQSTQTQVHTNLESQRRQYELVEVARRRGFREVEVIDDDLGRSASGTVARPGFERLVAWLCEGKVGAVLCFDASRVARNGRDWHHLLELCGLVEARVIDLDGVYDPCRPNDRLLLGMKGSISEFELGVLRARMLDAARAKARRGELRISVPIGYVWHREFGLGFDPDLRIQEVIRLIFARFRQLGSARQVLLSMLAEQIHFPRPSDGKKLVAFEWTPIRYRNVISVLKNPFYAGAYAYGKGEKRTEIVDGRARTSYGPPQTARTVGGAAEGSPRRLYQLGGIRTEPEAARRQRLWHAGRDEVGARWTRFAGGAALLRPLWASLGRQLLGPPSGTARLSLRSSQPDARAASVLHLQRRPRRRCGRPRASARRRTDGDRGGGGGGTEVHGRSK